VSNFAQIASVNQSKLHKQRGALSGRLTMPKSDQFQQYADEAVRWACRAKTEKEKQAYMDLARTWTRAALQSKHVFGAADDPPKIRVQ
jgi:hypothetical protein